nr:MAG TPA: hypothetical protein [Caudoviricetes sp.]
MKTANTKTKITYVYLQSPLRLPFRHLGILF